MLAVSRDTDFTDDWFYFTVDTSTATTGGITGGGFSGLGRTSDSNSIMAGFTYSTLTTAIQNYTEVGTGVLSSTITDQFIDNLNLEYKEMFQLMPIEKKSLEIWLLQKTV